jgi:hypothetical protein
MVQDLSKKLSMQELNDIIKDLPLNKAAGPSQITYEDAKEPQHKNKRKA